tara:strand:- start:3182 stop:3802 length:621 start_codon:yes stop_codon:yes gene_type:complete
MRHRNKKTKLGRKTAHRSSLLANLACSLIEHKRINTTVTKAKVLKRFIEPLITKTKDDSTHNRRIVFRYLRNKNAVSELFRKISNKIGDRPGGYTRIIKLGNRLGDNANMAMIEFVDFNELYKKSDAPKKSTRRGRSKSKSKIDKNLNTDKKAPEKVDDKAPEKVDDKAPEKVDDKALEKVDDKAPEKVDDKAPEENDNKVSKKDV